MRGKFSRKWPQVVFKDHFETTSKTISIQRMSQEIVWRCKDLKDLKVVVVHWWEDKFVKYNEAWRGTPQKIWGEKQILTSWWLNHPFEKYARQIGSFPQGSGWKLKKVSCHHKSWHLRHLVLIHTDRWFSTDFGQIFWNVQWSSRVFMHPHQKKTIHSNVIHHSSTYHHICGEKSVFHLYIGPISSTVTVCSEG